MKATFKVRRAGAGENQTFEILRADLKSLTTVQLWEGTRGKERKEQEIK